MATVRERLLAKVEPGPDGCLIWTGSTSTKGYGQIRVDGKLLAVHRVSYELFVGPIPEGAELDHLCHTRDESCVESLCLHRRCIRPDHVEPVSGEENMNRGRWRTKTACLRGHPYDEANTYIGSKGERRCRTCHRERVARAKARARRAA